MPKRVHRLLQRVLDWLPDTQQNTISPRRRRLRVEMKRRDDDVIAAVRSALDRAVGRQLRFDYLAPGQADGVPRTHVVQPWDLLRRHARP
ncbi:MAG: hypothetical protein R2851_16860 [Caldilineaceae bacterium]